MSGWYATKRGTLDHPLFKPDGPFSKFEAWHWLIERAAFKPTQIDIHGEIVTVPRGSICIALRVLAEEWSWTLKRVRTFLDRLERESTIHRKVVGNEKGSSKGTTRTLITLCNYDKYQADQPTRGTSEGAVGAQQGHIKEQGNNSDYVGAPDAPPPDPKKQAFDEGVRLLTAQGQKPAAARRIIGKWISQHGEGDVLAAILAARDKADAIAFVTRRLKPKAQTIREPADNYLESVHGISRVEIPDEDDSGNFIGGGHSRPPAWRHPKDDLSRVLAFPAQENRPVPQRDLRGGSNPDLLLALRASGGVLA